MIKIKLHIAAYISLISILLLLPGCSDDEKQGENSDEFITLYPKVKHDPIRINDTFFESGDEIGVFVVPYQQGNAQPGDISQSDYAVNIPHIYMNNTWQPTTGEPIRWPSQQRSVDIFSYYPYVDGFGENNPLAVPFTVETDQSTAANFTNSDLLWSGTLGIAPQNNPVELIFGHSLSKMRINLRTDIPISDEEFATSVISILNTNTGCYLNLSTGAITPVTPSSTGTIITFPHANPISGYRRTTEGILVPQTIPQGTPLIRIDFADGRRYIYTTETDILFEAGYERSFNIAITAQGLSVTVLAINNWDVMPEISGEINRELPQVLDLTTINWNQSRIHRVYDRNNVLVAEVCNEYIFSTQTYIVNYPGIVLYNVDNQGVVNRYTGHIAQALNRTRNSTTQEYEPNPANVHGGIVSWNADNTMAGYTAGTQALSNKVEITSDGINLAGENAIATLTTSPYYATDIDGNSYPVVKISQQYWMTENLKTEHFRNGDPAQVYYYNDDMANKNIYGGLYTWETVVDARGLCPEGWHAPVNNEFVLIYRYLTPDAGGKMKANRLWNNLNYGDNVSGFSGLPGGRRTNTGTYNQLLEYGQWWTTTQTSTTNAYRLYLSAGSWAMTNADLAKTYTQSVRCLRD